MEVRIAHVYYPNGECPNCFELIDEDAVEGDSCSSCGFAFLVDDDLLEEDYDLESDEVEDILNDDGDYWDHNYLEEDYDD